MKTKYYWHIHHEILVEALTEPLKNRIKCIKEDKPAEEIELRLRLMKPVRGKLPKALVKAHQAWDKAGQAWDKAYQAWDKAHQAWDKANQVLDEATFARAKADQARAKAYQAWDKANQAWVKELAENTPALEKLHKIECGCGWDGKTIFTKTNELKD